VLHSCPFRYVIQESANRRTIPFPLPSHSFSVSAPLVRVSVCRCISVFVVFVLIINAFLCLVLGRMTPEKSAKIWRIVSYVAGLLSCLISGTLYGFGTWAPTMKDVFNYDQTGYVCFILLFVLIVCIYALEEFAKFDLNLIIWS
jgi:hypothetical protein